MLDADEYLHLAIRASQNSDHQAALEHLHKALAQDPEHVGARYFLAAEHAELGLHERACEEMHALLLVAPELEIARFQWGLLSLQLDRKENAIQAFSLLAERARDESLQAFAAAYLQLLEGRPGDATASLREGLSKCANPALIGDMNRVLVGLSSAVDTDEKDEIANNGQPVYLGAYRNSDEMP